VDTPYSNIAGFLCHYLHQGLHGLFNNKEGYSSSVQLSLKT
jgi:hypothetical protein